MTTIQATPVTAAAPTRNTALIALALLITYVIWGTTYLGIRYALVNFPPFTLMGVRFVLAGGALLAWARWRGVAWPSPRQWRSAALVGLLLPTLGMGSVAYAEQTVTSGLAAALIATAPLWAILFQMLWRQFPTRLEVVGALLGVAGVLVLTLEGNLRANPTGVLLLLFATASWSFGSVWMRRLDMPPGAMGLGAELLCGGGLLCALALLSGERVVLPLDGGAVLALAYLTTFGSLATFTAYTYLLKTVSPTLATSYTLVNPVIALVLGAVLANETLTGQVWLALPLILVGVGALLYNRGKRATQ